MSGTNENLDPAGPFESGSFDPATEDLCLFDEAQLKALKRNVVLRQLTVEEEIVSLQEAQTVRVSEFNLEWDNFEATIADEIGKQEKRLQQMKEAQKRYKSQRKADLKLLEKEHKEANEVLVNTENLLNSSLQAIMGALKAIVTLRTRKSLTSVEFTPDTWENMD